MYTCIFIYLNIQAHVDYFFSVVVFMGWCWCLRCLLVCVCVGLGGWVYVCSRMFMRMFYTLQHTATHCNTLQHTAPHCNTLQHTATHCNTLQHTATHYNTLHHTASHCNMLQRLEVCVLKNIDENDAHEKWRQNVTTKLCELNNYT